MFRKALARENTTFTAIGPDAPKILGSDLKAALLLSHRLVAIVTVNKNGPRITSEPA